MKKQASSDETQYLHECVRDMEVILWDSNHRAYAC